MQSTYPLAYKNLPINIIKYTKYNVVYIYIYICEIIVDFILWFEESTYGKLTISDRVLKTGALKSAVHGDGGQFEAVCPTAIEHEFKPSSHAAFYSEMHFSRNKIELTVLFAGYIIYYNRVS